MQLKVKTVLNAVQHFPGFVFDDIRMRHGQGGQPPCIEVVIKPHAGMTAKCSRCRQPAPCYDRLPERAWLFVPLWGLVTRFIYAARRVQCPKDGVVVEFVPWSDGKRPVTIAMMCFLSRWARRLSWRETAQVFGTSWECVYRSVEWFVEWGLAHRKLENVQSIGVDEIHWGRGKGADTFLTVIYQIDGHCRRLLWVGKRRTQATLSRGLDALGDKVVKGLRFVSTDMWRPYLNVIATRAGHALHVLDRFHITMHLNQAVDEVRRAEIGRLRTAAPVRAARLKRMRWPLLRRGSREETLRIGHQQTRHRPGMDPPGNLPTLLALPFHDLGGLLSRCVDHPGAAQPPGADKESGANAAIPSGPADELVQGQG